MHSRYNPSDGTWCVYNNSGYLICSWKESESKMTKERELLRRALESCEIVWSEDTEIMKEIRSYLATPRTEQEPVAWRCCMPGQEPILLHDEPSDERYPPGYKDPLFYHPAPKRKPLSREDIETRLDIYLEQKSFCAGVRWAEKMHGIGEGND